MTDDIKELRNLSVAQYEAMNDTDRKNFEEPRLEALRKLTLEELDEALKTGHAKAERFARELGVPLGDVLDELRPDMALFLDVIAEKRKQTTSRPQ